MKLHPAIRKSLLRWATRVTKTRQHDFVIGPPHDPQVLRWWIMRSKKFLCIYVHRFVRSDDARALHDHRGINCSLLLQGRYREHLASGAVMRDTGSIIGRWPSTPHRIELLPFPGILSAKKLRPVLTIFITGPDWREWGFHCPQGWRPAAEFVAPHNRGEIGRGCD